MRGGQRRSLDDAYLCVADERRRHVLDYLRTADDGTAAFDDLVDHVVERESNSTPSDRESVIVDLYHVQLPRLADYGVVDYDGNPETIRYEPDELIESLLDGMTYPETGATGESG